MNIGIKSSQCLTGAADFILEVKGECAVQIHTVISFYGTFVDIDFDSNFTRHEFEPGLLSDYMIPSGCLVILWERKKKPLGRMKEPTFISKFLLFKSCCCGTKLTHDLNVILITIYNVSY